MITCQRAGGLAAGAVAPITVQTTVAPDVPTVELLAEARVQGPTGESNTLDNRQFVFFNVVPLWNFTQALAVAPATAKAGDAVAYVATVTNAGPNTSAGTATFSLALPIATRFASLAAATGWTCATPAVGATGTVSCTRNGLPVGAAQVFTVQATIATGTPPGTLTATAAVQNTLVDTSAADNAASAAVQVVPPAWNLTQGLTVSPAVIAPGGTIVYSVTTTNQGPDTCSPADRVTAAPCARAIRRRDRLGRLDVHHAARRPIRHGQLPTFGIVRPTVPRTFTVEATVAPGAPAAPLSATATVLAAAAESNVADNTATVIVTVAIPGPGDSDGDTLPDGWEKRFGLDPTDPSGPNGSAGDPDADGRTNAQELNDNTHPRGFFTRYFAEGATSTFFSTRFALLNVGTATANLQLRYLRGTGVPLVRPLTLGVNTRATVLPTDTTGMANAEFATIVESDQPLVADRTMTWDSTGYGSHAESSVAAPATTWYLAEGATHSGSSCSTCCRTPTPRPRSCRSSTCCPAALRSSRATPWRPPRAPTSGSTPNPASPAPTCRPLSPATSRSSSSAQCT